MTGTRASIIIWKRRAGLSLPGNGVYIRCKTKGEYAGTQLIQGY